MSGSDVVDDDGGGTGVKGTGVTSSIREIEGGSGVCVVVGVSSEDMNLPRWISNGKKSRIQRKNIFD